VSHQLRFGGQGLAAMSLLVHGELAVNIERLDLGVQQDNGHTLDFASPLQRNTFGYK
jgi:hypothetical protein